MIRLLEYINSDLSFTNFIKDLDKKEASPRKLKEYYSSEDIKSLLSEYGFYVDQADIFIGYTIKIYTNAFVPGMLTEAKIEITFFPSQFPHFIEVRFEIPNNGGMKKISSDRPNEELWDTCRKVWNEVTVPDYQRNSLKKQGYEFLS